MGNSFDKCLCLCLTREISRRDFSRGEFSYGKYLTAKFKTTDREKPRETVSANRRLRIILAHFPILSQGASERLELVTISLRPPAVYGTAPPILTHPLTAAQKFRAYATPRLRSPCPGKPEDGRFRHSPRQSPGTFS